MFAAVDECKEKLNETESHRDWKSHHMHYFNYFDLNLVKDHRNKIPLALKCF